VVDRRRRIPDDAQILDDAAETVVLDTAVPRFAMKALYDRGVRHVLLEGGPTLAGAFVEARCVDEVIAYLAPTLLGAGPAALGDAGIGTLADAVMLDIESVSRLGEDIKVVGRPKWAQSTQRAERAGWTDQTAGE
jgi:diaminohydroxyphosphoribosylaminopyrimidine deaminase/5-amino-6-(5-phosphoribosylamino)uracil reductase